MLDSMPPALLDALNMRAFNLTTSSGFYGIMFIYFALDGRHRRRHVGQRYDLQGREGQDGRVFPRAAGIAQPSDHRQGPGWAGQLHRLCLDHLGGVPGGGEIVQSRPELPQLPGARNAGHAGDRADLPGHRPAAGLRHEAVQTLRLNRHRHHPGDLLPVDHPSAAEDLDFLKYFTPFKYFDAGELFRTGKMDGAFLLLSAAIIVVCVVAAYWAYNRRDLYI